MKRYTVLIPAFQPDNKLIELVDSLCLRNINVLVVDDGSGPNYTSIFNQVSNYGVHVLHHEKNQGKGMAIKTGIKDLMDKDDLCGIVTADADGQHTVDDICYVIAEMKKHPGVLIIGARSFVGKVPLRSRIGNTITRKVFHFVTSLNINDTQSGLRGLPKELCPQLLTLKSDHYDYEMDVLLNLKHWGVDYLEVPISTVYIKDNASSHFNTLSDSWRIYSEIIKFIGSSFTSFLIDYGGYIVFNLVFLVSPWLSYLLARVISSIVNYLLNRHVVFGDGKKSSFVKYYILAISVMVIGSAWVALLTKLNVHSILAKFSIDIPMFFFNYKVQQKYIFRK